MFSPQNIAYDPTGCASGGNIGSSDVNSGSAVCCVEGFELPGLLGMAVSDLGGSAVAAISPDLYGLEEGDHWNGAGGSILGEGKGSQAVFTSGSEEAITVDASSCAAYGGFVAFALPCHLQGFTGTGPPLKPDAFSLWQYVTKETNNLVPVIGSPPKHLPVLTWTHGGWVARLNVTETVSGHCVSGSPPLC